MLTVLKVKQLQSRVLGLVVKKMGDAKSQGLGALVKQSLPVELSTNDFTVTGNEVRVGACKHTSNQTTTTP